MKQLFPKDAYSGAKFFLEIIDNELIIKKCFKTDVELAKKSIRKQQSFKSQSINNDILVRAAPVYGINFSVDHWATLKFPFEFGLSGSSLLSRGSLVGILLLKSFVEDHIKQIIFSVKGEELNRTRMFNKIRSFTSDKRDCEIKEKLNKVISELEKKIETKAVFWPANFSCHGDLTLSNIIVNEDERKIVLIDFSAVYAENAIQDLTKLIQDIWYGWTSRRGTQLERDRSKIISNSIWPKELWHNSPKWLQVATMIEVYVTLMRIAPYISENDNITKRWLLNSLKLHHEKFEFY